MTARSNVLGVVLGGGQARRMGGGDKCLLEIAGRPLLDYIVERLEPETNGILLNANGDPARFAGFALPVAADVIPGFGGPLMGILTAMRWAQRHRPRHRFVATVAGDTPFFPPNLVTRFLDERGEADNAIALAASEGQVQPIFGLWPVHLADHLESWLNSGDDRRVLGWVACHKRVDVDFPVTSGIEPFFNINRPEDLETAESLVAGVLP